MSAFQPSRAARLARSTPARRPLAIALTAAWAACVAGAALAQSAEPATATLSTVVVTASGNAQELRDAPASVSVITREDLERKPVQELAELLGSVEGVTLNRSGNLVPGVQLRGLGAAYTLILIDGKRVNATSAMFRGNDYDTGWVPVDEVERIEVVRGPMSSLYGSDAIGGVVNIITRPIGKTWRGSARMESTMQEHTASGDSRAFGFALSGPLAEQFGLKLSGSTDRRDADGSVNSVPAGGTTRQPGLQKIDNRYLSTQLAWTPDSRQTVTADVDASRRDHASFIMEREALSLTHKGRWDFGTTELTAYADEIRNLIGTISGQTNPNRANTASLNGKVNVPIAWGNQFATAGFEVREEKLHDPANLQGLPGTPGFGNSPDTSVSQYALFLEDEIRFTERFALTLGDRWDHHENFGGHHSPRAYGVVHLSDKLTMKGGVSRAFRAPTLLQGSPNWGSVSCGSATVGCYIVGSRDLKPETGTSQELGLQYAGEVHNASVTLFNTDLKNMIDITNRTANAALGATYDNFVGLLPDGRPIFRYQNIAKVRSRGLEAGWKATLSPTWSTRATYTFTDAKNLSGATPLPLTYRPRHSVNLGADWRASPTLTVGGGVRVVSGQYISVPSSGLNKVERGGYGIADLTMAWQFSPEVGLRTGLLNINGKKFDRVNSADFNEEGRRLFISLNAKF